MVPGWALLLALVLGVLIGRWSRAMRAIGQAHASVHSNTSSKAVAMSDQTVHNVIVVPSDTGGPVRLTEGMIRRAVAARVDVTEDHWPDGLELEQTADVDPWGQFYDEDGVRHDLG